MNDMTYPVASTERVKTWLEGAVLHIRFNNPAKHNALSVDMWEAVPPLLEQAEKDDNVRMVVFSGEGDKAFVSGADISQFEDLRAQKEAVKRYEQTGRSRAAGHLRVRQADHRLHSRLLHRRRRERGDQLRHPRGFVRLGLLDSRHAPGTRLSLLGDEEPRRSLVGPGYAKDIFFTGRRLDAAEALRIGLVNRVAPPDGLDALLANTRPRSPPARRSPSRRASGSSGKC